MQEQPPTREMLARADKEIAAWLRKAGNQPNSQCENPKAFDFFHALQKTCPVAWRLSSLIFKGAENGNPFVTQVPLNSGDLAELEMFLAQFEPRSLYVSIEASENLHTAQFAKNWASRSVPKGASELEISAHWHEQATHLALLRLIPRFFAIADWNRRCKSIEAAFGKDDASEEQSRGDNAGKLPRKPEGQPIGMLGGEELANAFRIESTRTHEVLAAVAEKTEAAARQTLETSEALKEFMDAFAKKPAKKKAAKRTTSKDDPDRERILNAWRTRQHQTYEACGKALGLDSFNNRSPAKRVHDIVRASQKAVERKNEKAETSRATSRVKRN